ncbi:hypothetical protein P152DRAFT_424960 [Eremomyces bilateralis CBS 781.70]|uniref:Rhodopsin domain-containing protein n=1 Tax=Eremomyces bilateralis CBS 781.70 TaxID=1392243 RepID=A0A6G1FRT9_9PEZI|nr:uncharacterized protein P152DRAFT_424960 [Eremomyces bilateralis CBS 781.70]KAF1808448.1 hypothetical protein P152DRAFT_424960 [Eremomyces bilateralis CBS 781.70]
MSQLPTLDVVLSWPTPDYENPRDVLDPLVWGVDITLIVLTTIFIVCRFYSRIIIIRNALGMDDWTMLMAYVCAVATAILHIVELDVGVGRHLYDVKLEWVPTIAKMAVATQVLFGPTSALTKISVCLTYLRIFPSRTNSRFNYVCIVLLIATGLAWALPPIFQCWPIKDAWDYFKVDRKCMNLEPFSIAMTAVNAFTDCLVFLWPVHYLWKVKLSLNKRVGLILSFSLGVIVCIVSIVRIGYIVKYFDTWDVTHIGTIIYVITDVETGLGIICGCLPGIRPAMRKCFPGLVHSTDNRSGALNSRRHTDLTYGGPLSSHQSHRAGYRDIHVTRDVEMKASPAPVKTRTLGNISDDESQEWVFRTDIQTDIRTDIRGPHGHVS